MQQPSVGGYIKLYRSMVMNGHLQMPDQALKVFVFLLLKVNYAAGSGCEPGEGWITYDMIRDRCSDPTRGTMPNSSVSRALTYLERKKYIERIKDKRGAGQRIRIVNWDKYQGELSSEEIQPMIQPPIQPVIQPVIHKEEEERKPRRGRKGEPDSPNGESPAATEPKFPPEAHQLVNTLWNFLDVREALPPTPKGKVSWRMSNLHFATKQMLDPSGGKSLQDWLACLEWAGAQTYWATKITTLPKLASVWSEYQLQTKAQGRNGQRIPRGASSLMDWVNEGGDV